jgi:hypothetical protein
MQAYSSGDQFWVDHQEPHSDNNHRANNDQNARPTRHATSLAQSRQQSRWRSIGEKMNFMTEDILELLVTPPVIGEQIEIEGITIQKPFLLAAMEQQCTCYYPVLRTTRGLLSPVSRDRKARWHSRSEVIE